MKKPIIGLTTYPDSDSHGWHTPKLYIEAVIRAGGIPVQLPGNAIDSVDGWLNCVDGLIFIGGGDVHPSLYGGEMHETIYNLSPERDATEMALMKAVIANPKPTLAICRGLQILNTVLNGSLYEHIPDVFGEIVLHRAPPRNDILHSIKVDENSDLVSLLSPEIATASWHHQSVKDLGNGLRAVAWAPDGVIEAVELEGRLDLVAVQWHPEITASTDIEQQGLFDWLIKKAS